MKVSVVIPTYNEVDNLEELFSRIRRSLEDYEVIVVDDGSPDGTAEVASRLNGVYGEIRVLNRGRRLGLASAVLDGVRAASGEVVVVMDADLQHPPEIIPKLIEQIEDGADLAVASRYMKGGGTSGWSATRRLTSRIATTMAHILIPPTRDVSDPLSGFFAARRKLFDQSLKPTGYKILLELIAASSPKVAEVPYTFYPRRRGESKLDAKEFYNYVRLLLRLSGYRPLKFAAVGALGVMVNEAVLLYLLKLHLLLPLASLTSIEVSVISNFAINSAWTYRGRSDGRVRKLAKYHLAVLSGLIVNFTVLLGLASLGLPAWLADLSGVLLGFAANYIASELYVWRK